MRLIRVCKDSKTRAAFGGSHWYKNAKRTRHLFLLCTRFDSACQSLLQLSYFRFCCPTPVVDWTFDANAESISLTIRQVMPGTRSNLSICSRRHSTWLATIQAGFPSFAWRSAQKGSRSHWTSVWYVVDSCRDKVNRANIARLLFLFL